MQVQPACNVQLLNIYSFTVHCSVAVWSQRAVGDPRNRLRTRHAKDLDVSCG